MYQILLVREKFTSSSPSLAKSKTFTFNGTTFFCVCLLAEKMNETGKLWKTGSWVFGCSDNGQSKTAFVTFKDPKALEIALLLSVGSLVFLFFCCCYYYYYF